jgi:pimeloyl-ACP methyl ester carboxylesterase
MNSVLPLSARVRGIEVDGRTKMKPWPLERLKCPVLVVSATDDLYRTLPGAQSTAQRIPGAELHVLKSGGHLMVGQSGQVTAWIRHFLEQRPDPRRLNSVSRGPAERMRRLIAA